jgi:hypothetical protein
MRVSIRRDISNDRPRLTVYRPYERSYSLGAFAWQTRLKPTTKPLACLDNKQNAMTLAVDDPKRCDGDTLIRLEAFDKRINF